MNHETLYKPLAGEHFDNFTLTQIEVENIKKLLKSKFKALIINNNTKIINNKKNYFDLASHVSRNGIQLKNELQHENKKFEKIARIATSHGSNVENYTRLHYVLCNKLQDQLNDMKEPLQHFLIFLNNTHIGGDGPLLDHETHEHVDRVIDGIGMFGLGCFGMALGTLVVICPPVTIGILAVGCFSLSTWLIAGSIHGVTTIIDEGKQMRQQRENLINEINDHRRNNGSGGGNNYIHMTYKDIVDIGKTVFVNIRLSKDAKDFIINFINSVNIKTNSTKNATILNQNSKRFCNVNVQQIQTIVIRLINKAIKKSQKQDSKTIRAIHFI